MRATTQKIRELTLLPRWIRWSQEIADLQMEESDTWTIHVATIQHIHGLLKYDTQECKHSGRLGDREERRERK